MKLAVTSEDIKRQAELAGADFLGIADVSVLKEMHPDNDAERFMRGAKAIVIAGIADPPGAATAPDKQEYTSLAYPGYHKADGVTASLSRMLREKGYRAKYIVREWLFEKDRRGKQVKVLSLKAAAEAAGLGTIGRHTLLITPEWGSGVRMSGFITDAPLEPDAPLEKPLCDDCGACAAKCPSGAIGDAAEDYDFWKCSVYLFSGVSLEDLKNGITAGDPEGVLDALDGLRQTARGWRKSIAGGRRYFYSCGSCVRTCNAHKRNG